MDCLLSYGTLLFPEKRSAFPGLLDYPHMTEGVARGDEELMDDYRSLCAGFEEIYAFGGMVRELKRRLPV